jgi:hypothetical protein
MSYLFEITYDYEKMYDISHEHNIKKTELMKQNLKSIAKSYACIELEDFDIKQVGQRLSVKDSKNREYIIDCGLNQRENKYFIKLSEKEKKKT